MQEILGRAARTLRPRRDHRQGRVYNTDLMETVELGYLLDCAEAWWSAPALARRAGAPTTGRTTRSRDDANWLKHTLAYRNDDGSIRLDFKPVKMGPYVPMERKY